MENLDCLKMMSTGIVLHSFLYHYYKLAINLDVVYFVLFNITSIYIYKKTSIRTKNKVTVCNL